MTDESISAEMFKRMREAQAAQQAERSRQDAGKNFQRWKKGQRFTVRILPPVKATEFPFVEGGVHYGINPPLPCLGKSGCPLCDVIQYWRKEGYNQHEYDIKNLRAKAKGYYKIIIRQDRPLVPKFMSHGSSFTLNGVHDKIFKLFTRPGAETSGHPASIYNGFDIDIELPFAGAGYLFEPSMDRSPLASSQEEIDRILADAAKLDLNSCIYVSEDQKLQIKSVAEDLLAGRVRVRAFGDKDDDAPAAQGPKQEYKLKTPPFCFGNPNKREEFKEDTCIECPFVPQCDEKILALGPRTIVTGQIVTDNYPDAPDWLQDPVEDIVPQTELQPEVEVEALASPPLTPPPTNAEPKSSIPNLSKLSEEHAKLKKKMRNSK